jgi:DNA-binding NarL/FixJ family response regulator
MPQPDRAPAGGGCGPDQTWRAAASRLVRRASVTSILHDNRLLGVGSSRPRSGPLQIAQGLSNARIAEQLQIGEKTVRNHASNLFDKLGVRSRAEAIVFAREHGFMRSRAE